MDAIDKYDSFPPDQSSMKVFTSWVVLSQVFGLTAVILAAVWLGNFRGGFAWQKEGQYDLEFNYHPLFMIIGLIFLYGDSILVYRVFRNEKKITVKILHGLLHAFALIFSGVGLKAVFDSHNLPEKKTPNLYSLHSWIGLSTIILFGMQWVVGLVTFLLPGLSMRIRSAYKPFHVFWGLAIFAMAIATALTGLTEKSLFSNSEYSQKNAEGILVNCLGLCLMAVGLTVGYVVSKPDYARQNLPDEEHLQLTN